MRKDKCLTQSRMSELLDIQMEGSFSGYKAGTSSSLEKLMEIAQILDVSTDFILFGSERNNSDTISLHKILADLNDVQKLYLEMILRVAAENIGMVC